MSKISHKIKAMKEKMYLTDGVEYVRTVPIASGDDAPLVGYVKTTVGEHKVAHDNEVLHDLFMTGEEISEEEYVKTKLTVVNHIAI